ncbi:MAG: NAD(P)/FAD-dependent oxidoreductase [Chitinophagaceae bacterium]
MSHFKSKTLVVVGGGAAGFFCAINAAQMSPNLQVIIVEKNNKLLSKVKISGGGRCNVTHACFDIVELSKKYPRGEKFLKKAFHWFNTNSTIDWFANRGVQLKTEADGRMFPESNTSETIIDCLLNQANKLGVTIFTSVGVKDITKQNGKFEVILDNKNLKNLQADFVCIASGGFPKLEQFNWLQQLGHTIENPIPSLFTFNIPNNNITQLMGVSVEKATVKIVGSKLQSEGALLITHWGLSGPAVLKLSAFAARELANKNYSFEAVVNWLPNHNEQTLKEVFLEFRSSIASQKISGKNSFGLPYRLWDYLLQLCAIDKDLRWADLSSKKQNDLIKNLTSQLFKVSGKTTFKEEFVTCGGIKLTEVDVNTMQSKIADNIFFAGEVLDIDGITGGFNFQNAWTTGWIAAKAIAQKSLE